MKNNRTEEEYREAAKKSFSIAGMCRELGLKPFGAGYRSIHKAIEKYNQIRNDTLYLLVDKSK